MCGIAGLVGEGAERRLETIRGMSRIQRHRGPDADGVFADAGVSLGHVRLAILDLSEAGRQPMATPDGRYVIVYNGEVYNYLELRKELTHTGPFVTDTDTEVILRAYAAWGPACLERFVGMFAFAIWDRHERSLFCARDRFGIKPFYYARHGGVWVFASEIKAVLAAGVPRRPCLPVLHAYLAQGHYEHSAHTFFEGVLRLPPGHTLTLRPGGEPQVRRYYALEERVNDAPGLSEDEAAARLRALLEDAVRLHLRSDVKVGVNLSGGLDSSIMLALVDRLSDDPERLEAFSCDYPEQGRSERQWVEAMSRATRRRVNFSVMGPEELWRSFDAVLWHEEEPFGGIATSAWTGLYQCAAARRVTVLLGGTGLDDILAGYRSSHLVHLAGQSQAAGFDRELDAYAAAWRVRREDAAAEVRRVLREGWETMALDGTNPVRPDCLTDAFAGTGSAPEAFARPFESPLKNQMYQGLAYTKIPRALRFKDRMSMAYSKELRVPFLDHRLVEFCFGLPDDLLIRQGFTKYVLRRAMAGLLPEAVQWAPKRSVPTPQREWLAGPLADRIDGVLTSPSFASRGLVDPAKAGEAFARYRQGERENSFYLWQWISVERWFQLFIDPPHLRDAPAPADAFPSEAWDPGRDMMPAAARGGGA